MAGKSQRGAHYNEWFGTGDQIDRLIVEKSLKTLSVFAQLEAYGVSLGWESVGRDTREVDLKTAESIVEHRWSNPARYFMLAAHIDPGIGERVTHARKGAPG